MRRKNIAIMGLDPAGVVMGALLFQTGFMVDMIDPRGRGEPVPLENGVRIVGSLDVRLPLFYYKVEQIFKSYDAVFLTCEDSAVPDNLERIRPYLKPKGTVCVLGTGESDFGRLKTVCGTKPVIGTMSINARWEGSSVINCTSSARHMVYDHLFELGEIDNTVTPRLLATKSLLENIGLCSISQGVWDDLGAEYRMPGQ